MNRTFFKWVGTWSPKERKLRLFRIVRWVGNIGDGKGHSTMYTLSLVPAIWRVERSFADIAVTLAGVRFHWQRAWGGRHV